MNRDTLKAIFKITNRKEGLFYFLLGVIFFGYFYLLTNVFIFSFLCSFFSMFLWGFFKERKKKREAEKFTLVFQDFLYVFSSQLAVGKSMENSLAYSIEDLKNIHGNQDMLVIHLEKALYQYSLGKPFEEGFDLLLKAYTFDWLENFIDMIKIARLKGGDFINLLKKTSQIIAERLEIEREIEVILAKQNLEVKILRGMPFILLLVFKALYPEMITFLTSQVAGLVFFSIAAVLIGFSFYYSNRLVKVIWS